MTAAEPTVSSEGTVTGASNRKATRRKKNIRIAGGIIAGLIVVLGAGYGIMHYVYGSGLQEYSNTTYSISVPGHGYVKTINSSKTTFFKQDKHGVVTSGVAVVYQAFPTSLTDKEVTNGIAQYKKQAQSIIGNMVNNAYTVKNVQTKPTTSAGVQGTRVTANLEKDGKAAGSVTANFLMTSKESAVVGVVVSASGDLGSSTNDILNSFALASSKNQ